MEDVGGSSRGSFGVSTESSRHGWGLHAHAGNSIFGLVDLAVRGREQLDLTITMGGKKFYQILTVILLKLIQKKNEII